MSDLISEFKDAANVVCEKISIVADNICGFFDKAVTTLNRTVEQKPDTEPALVL